MLKTILLINKTHIIGADECGNGSIAGPVFVCALRAPNDWALDGLNDSKQLTDKQRRVMDKKLRLLAEADIIQFNIHREDAWVIDEIGIGKALQQCYIQAVSPLYKEDTNIVIDGSIDYFKDSSLECKAIVKADTFIPAVMAASIIGKVARDDMMIKMAPYYPNYSFEVHKGYGSADHIAAIKKYGRSVYHRTSYKLKALGEK